MIQQSMGLKVLIFPLSLVIVVAAIIFYIMPSFSEMMTAKNSLSEKTSQLDSLKNQDQKLQNVKSKWDALTDEKTLVATALPETDNVDSYISEISSKASSSGVLLTYIKMDKNSDATLVPAYVCGAVSAGTDTTSITGAPAPAQPSASGVGAVQGTQTSPNSTDCLKTVEISMTAKGSWEQILDFFKYLEDMNRFSNVRTITLEPENKTQNQAPSDLLTADVSATAFFKATNKSGNAILASSIASQGDFNQKAMEKLKEAIYSIYNVPSMSPSGERNIFK